jgi:hypothetical protein
MTEPPRAPDLSEDSAFFTIRFPKETAQHIHVYAAQKGETVEEFIVELIKGTIHHFQTSEKLMKDFEEWKIPSLNNVVPFDDYVLNVKFEGGLEGKYDLKASIQQGGVFSSLSDIAYFGNVFIGGNGQFVAWPNEIEIGADSIYWGLTTDDDRKWNDC